MTTNVPYKITYIRPWGWAWDEIDSHRSNDPFFWCDMSSETKPYTLNPIHALLASSIIGPRKDASWQKRNKAIETTVSDLESTWKASSLYSGATLSHLWATLGYSSLLFWATGRSWFRVVETRIFQVGFKVLQELEIHIHYVGGCL